MVVNRIQTAVHYSSSFLVDFFSGGLYYRIVVFQHIMFQSLIDGAVTTAYIFIFMILISPMVWGYADYPQREKTRALRLAVPWFLFLLGFPIWSALQHEDKLGGDIPFGIAFLNIFMMFFWSTFGALVLLEWFLISRSKPGFVIIPDSKREYHRNFSHRFRGHLKVSVVMIIGCLIMAAAFRLL